MDSNDDTVGRRGRPVDFVSSTLMSAHTLPEGTRLLDYEITGLIGEGGFGIVYLAWDHSLQRRIAIKEYMPSSMASRAHSSVSVVVKSERHADTFRAGLKSFVNEARLLARFNHPALVKVYQFWEQNGTAYMVMPYYEGPTLKHVLAQRNKPPDESELRTWLRPLLDALAVMHAAHCFHRDIAPDNILLTPSGPLLLDFGAARRVIGDMTHALTVMLKPGFAPIEQYGEVATMGQGAWTDLYALASVVYAAVTGHPPMSSVERLMDDRLEPLSELAAGRYSTPFLSAVDAALSVRPRDRPQDVAAFRQLLDGRALHAEPVPGFSVTLPASLDDEEPERIDRPEPTLPHPHPHPPVTTLPQPPAIRTAAFVPLPAAPVAPLPPIQPPPPPSSPQPERRPITVPLVPPPRVPSTEPARDSDLEATVPPPERRSTPPDQQPTRPPSTVAPRRTSPTTVTPTVKKKPGKTPWPLYGAVGLVLLAVLAGAAYLLTPGRHADPSTAPEHAATPPSASTTTLPAGVPAPAAPLATVPTPTPTSTPIPDSAPASAAVVEAAPAATVAPPVVEATRPPPAAAARPAAVPASRPKREPRVVPPEATRRPAAEQAESVKPESTRAKCSDILQKASLEPLTPSEATFLKRECR